MDIRQVIDTGIYTLGVLSLLFGVIGGLYAGIQWIKRTFFAPRIKLAFDKAKTFHNRRDAKTGTDYIWIHVQAINESKIVLSSCKAYLTEIRTISANSSIAPVPDFNSKLPLAWAHSGGMHRVDLLPEEQSAIDLFMVDHHHKLLVTCTDQIPAGTQKLFPPGKYLLKVKCFSDEAKTGEIVLQIEWDGIKPHPSVVVM